LFGKYYWFQSEKHSLYATSVFLKNKMNLHLNDFSLIKGCEHGHTRTVALLLAHKANVHAKNDSALLQASKHGHKDTVVLLIKHKANVHVEYDYGIRFASLSRSKEIIDLLLEETWR
jgi:ankyrin repeat protein